MFIAAAETVAVPILILFAVMFVIAIAFGLLASMFP
jgi:hypothetical protein